MKNASVIAYFDNGAVKPLKIQVKENGELKAFVLRDVHLYDVRAHSKDVRIQRFKAKFNVDNTELTCELDFDVFGNKWSVVKIY